MDKCTLESLRDDIGVVRIGVAVARVVEQQVDLGVRGPRDIVTNGSGRNKRTTQMYWY